MCGVGHYWNPLTDWNYWREIEEKLMEDEELFRKMLHNFVLSFPNEKKDEAGAWQYIYADIPERCKALYLAYQSING